MANPRPSRQRPSVADALVRLWMAAQIAMAGLLGWQAWLLLDWPDDTRFTPASGLMVTQAITIMLLLPAAVVVERTWRASRDRALALLVLLFGLGSAASFASWAGMLGTVALAGQFRLHYVADAAIALAGAALAARALRLRRAAQPGR